MSAKPRALPPLEPEVEPVLDEVLAEALPGQRQANLREAQFAWASTLACDAWEIPEGPLLWRLGILAERAKAYMGRSR